MKFYNFLSCLFILFVLISCQKIDSISEQFDKRKFPLKKSYKSSITKTTVIAETKLEPYKLFGIFTIPPIKVEEVQKLPDNAKWDPDTIKMIDSIYLTHIELTFLNENNKNCIVIKKSGKCTKTNKNFIKQLKLFAVSKQDDQSYEELKKQYEDDVWDDEDYNREPFEEFDQNPTKYGGVLMAQADTLDFEINKNTIIIKINSRDIKKFILDLKSTVIKIIAVAQPPEVTTTISGLVKMKINLVIPTGK